MATRRNRIDFALADNDLELCEICGNVFKLNRGGYERHRVVCEDRQRTRLAEQSSRHGKSLQMCILFITY